MNLPDLPEHAIDGLRARNVAPEAELAIRLLLWCLGESCQMVAEDCGPDRYDDSVSEGSLRWRRTRNRALKELRRGHDELKDVRADVSDNALRIINGRCAVSFWSAPDGVSRPRLSVASKSKRAAVDQMQLQIEGVSHQPALFRLALLYEADELGLLEAAVGVLSSPSDWHWEVVVFRRSAGDDFAQPAHPHDSPPVVPHDEQPIPDLPPIMPRRRRDAETADEL